MHVEPRPLGGERLPGLGEGALADVDGDVGVQVREGVEQVPCLLGGTGTEFDQGAGPGRRRDVAGAREQDLPFGARRVVLGQFGDLLEQVAAVGVVEPLRRQCLGSAGETPVDIGAQRGVRGVLGQIAGEAERAHVRGSFSDAGTRGSAGSFSGVSSTSVRLAARSVRSGTSCQCGSSS